MSDLFVDLMKANDRIKQLETDLAAMRERAEKAERERDEWIKASSDNRTLAIKLKTRLTALELGIGDSIIVLNGSPCCMPDNRCHEALTMLSELATPTPHDGNKGVL